MTFGEHTEYEYESVGPSLKQGLVLDKLSFTRGFSRSPHVGIILKDSFGIGRFQLSSL